jgi:hypothetical protein
MKPGTEVFSNTSSALLGMSGDIWANLFLVPHPTMQLRPPSSLATTKQTSSAIELNLTATLKHLSNRIS